MSRIPALAINHLSNYNSRGSIGCKTEVYGAQARRAGRKEGVCGVVFGARRGDVKEGHWVGLIYVVLPCVLR